MIKTKLEKLFDSWEEDYIIQIDLEVASRKTPELWHKYAKIYFFEKNKLELLESNYRTLCFDLTTFFTDGPSNAEEHKAYEEKGWVLPAKGKISLKSEVQKYVENHKQVIELSLKISTQKTYVDALDSILKQINNRSYLINSAIENKKFENGIR